MSSTSREQREPAPAGTDDARHDARYDARHEHARPDARHDDVSPERPAGRRGRVVGRVLTPVLAVAPWLTTMLGLALAAQWNAATTRADPARGGWLVAAVVVLLLAALLWAALSAWSSLGTLVAGCLTLLLAAVVVARPRLIFDLVQAAPVRASQSVYFALAPPVLLLLGTMLVAVGLAAAARGLLGRRR